MTLVLNEIHVLNGLADSFMIAAADRQLVDSSGRFFAKRKKLFPVRSIHGAISYFGVAQVMSSQHRPYLSDWLQTFIAKHTNVHSISAFANELKAELNRLVSPTELAQFPSGFHICGYQEEGYPDFWLVTNIGEAADFNYRDLRPAYDTPTSHFLGRDALAAGWDGHDPTSIRELNQIYRNGDYRSHVATSMMIDEMLRWLAQFPDFPPPTTPPEYRDYVDFKFGFIDYLYRRRARSQIVAKPFDILLLTPP